MLYHFLDENTPRVVWEFTKDGKMIEYSYFAPIKKWVEKDPRPYSYTPSADGTTGTLNIDSDKYNYELTNNELKIHPNGAPLDFIFKPTKGIKGDVKASDM